MLVEFRVFNFRSIGEEQVLSLVPAPKQKEYEENILVRGKAEALNMISLYGANASGKSNLIKALKLFDRMIHLSARSSSTTQLPYEPFLLREGWSQKPTKFEMTFIAGNNNRYRYGFEFNQTTIISEWLFRKGIGREVSVFSREEEIIEVSSGFQGSSKLIDASIEATKSNALFLSTCDMLNVTEATELFQWFRHFNIVDALETEPEEIATVRMWEKSEYRQKIRDYFSVLRLGFKDLDIITKEFDARDLPSTLDDRTRNTLSEKLQGSIQYSVNTIHQLYDSQGKESGKTLSWDFDQYESAGTKQAFKLSGPILWALVNGGVLVIDEIEAKMHPAMTLNTINLFLNKETNINHAQLIFATHDTNLLTYLNLRRDQIYFAEKNNWESTEIYSLSDMQYYNSQKERSDTDKEKRYLEGRYGAIPVFGSFLSILNR